MTGGSPLSSARGSRTLVRLKSAGPEKSASAAGLARKLISPRTRDPEHRKSHPPQTPSKNPPEYLYCSVNTSGVIIPRI
jgi:hypothetical protein